MTSTPRPATLVHPDVEVRVSDVGRRRPGPTGRATGSWSWSRPTCGAPSATRWSTTSPGASPATAPTSTRRTTSSRQRARQLGRAHLDGVEPSSIRWATNQTKRWGSCTLATREIRISSRLRVVPTWVLDAVIVHELAHLLEPGHTARFRALESRFPRRREADVFLEGYALGLHMDVPVGIDGPGGTDDAGRCGRDTRGRPSGSRVERPAL